VASQRRHPICRTLDPGRAAVEDVRVDHGGVHVAVAEQLMALPHGPLKHGRVMLASAAQAYQTPVLAPAVTVLTIALPPAGLKSVAAV